MAAFDLSHLATLLSGVVITGLGFMIKRRITGAKAQERVTLFAGLADISAKMKQHGLSVDDVSAMEAFVSSKRRAGVLLASASAQTEVFREETAVEPEGYWTQAAMNQRADASFRTVDAQLAEALLELEHFSDGEHLRSAQEAWEHFREQQAEFAASQYAGGSIAPLIAASEAQAVTEQRLAWARAEIEERRRL